MKSRILLAGLGALSLSSSALAQAPAAAPDFSAEAFRAHVAFLADDLLEGREAGTRGYDLAARYVAAQFAALGLQPAANGNWYQRVEFLRFTPTGTPQLTIGGRSFAQGEEVVFRASPSTEALALDAGLVFAGYGIDAPPQGFDDYAGLDVRGKVVVIIAGSPNGTPSDVAAHLNSAKARMAAARGAIGMIVVRSRAEAEATPWNRLVTGARRPGTTWIGRDGQPFDGSGLRFTAYADGAAAAALFQGSRRSLDQVLNEAARRGARPRGFALTRTARVERPAAETSRFASENVVALLPGTDPALADEYVLLMAHLDGLGVREAEAGDTANADRIRNGAMDNATGIATLIEVARAMSQPGNRPRRPVLIAAVTAEEKGLLGAEFLSRNPIVDGRIVGLVNLDMPVLTYDFQDVIAFGAEHSTLGPIVRRAAARMNVVLAGDPLPQESLFVRSDHYKFVLEGVPSVFLMTGFGGAGQERFTSFLRTFYHSPEDDIALPFNWAAGAKFAQLNYLIAREIADGAEAPRWYADSFFGTTLARDQQLAQRPAATADRGGTR
ncbi:M28 family metallopeptidase [Sphingosinicella sp. LHD-64]|uniref:M28 family metallopeptidase n=1 Tax=Sphingosinicella sp. LHD-64 TaxID=3072139 RepID=UPI00280E8800|nr:M28 family metallopeptidase [Sphingosinicella sp. LHD-64]MDQ8754612.1 M28 family metallopeptidase [Sphingosinicella sp. LHD-64]